MRCSRCQFVNPDSMAFCGKCGERLGSARCQECDAEIPTGYKYCGHCGTAVGSLRDTDAAEHRQITVLFCDLVESTSMSGRIDPEDLRQVIQEYHAIAGEVIDRFAGHVAQYLGDGMLVYFGYPNAHEDDAVRAAFCGLELTKAFHRDAHPRLRAAGQPIEVRIAAHTGEVVVDDIGRGEHKDRLAMGETPNIAARLQSVAKAGQMLVSDSTHRLLDGRVSTRALGAVSLKGVDREVSAYEVIAVRGAGLVPEPDDATPIVGRNRELDFIEELQRQSARGEGQVVLIKGEAGIGKSRLRRESQQRLADRLDGSYVFRCSALFRHRPLYPISEMLRNLSRGGDSRSELRRWLTKVGLGTDNYVDTLGDLLGESTVIVDETDASRRRGRVVQMVVETLLAVSSTGPSMLVFEDLQWADPTTLEVLERLTKAISNYRILLLMTCRQEFEQPWVPGPEQSQIELTRLSKEDSESLVGHCSESKLPAVVVAGLVAHADGVPLYLEEMTRFAVEQRDRHRAGESSIPPSLRDSFMARLDALGEAKETAQLGALLGRGFSLKLLQRVSDLPSTRLDLHLRGIVKAGLLQVRMEGNSPAYVFKHALIQDSAYESMLKRDRQKLHKQVVQAMRQLGDKAAPDTLAWHLEGADELDEAVKEYRRAATLANERWAFLEAVGLYRKAHEILLRQPSSEKRDRSEMRILNAMIEPLRATRSYTDEELYEIFDRKLELVRKLEPRRQFGSLMSLWSAHCARGDQQHTEIAANELYALAQELGDQEHLALGHVIEGCTRFYKGDQPAALEHLEKAARAIPADASIAMCKSALQADVVRAWSLGLTGRYQTSQAVLENVLHWAENKGSPFDVVQVLCHWNVIDQDFEADTDVVLSRAHRIRRVASEHDMQTWVWFSQLHSGWCRARSGDEGGVQELKSAMERCYASDLSTTGHTTLTLVQALVSLGRFDRALAELGAADAFFDRNLACFPRADAYRWRGVCLHHKGDESGATECFEQAVALAREQGAALLELKALADQAKLLGADAPLRNRMAQLYEGMPEAHQTPALTRIAGVVGLGEGSAAS